MKLTLLVIGKTDAKFLQEGIKLYNNRLKHYIDFNIEVIPDIKKTKNVTETIQKQKEGEAILNKLSVGSEFHIFDEDGKMYSSRGFAGFLQKKMVYGLKELVLVIGGPYGFSEEIQVLPGPPEKVL
ncbi:MAG: 23S rRNA (pseudouridine(1915)-N(3))-methyltransferase RlmH, partial [Prolixibacteraceae bacterium]